MRFIAVKTYEELSNIAADLIAAQIMMNGLMRAAERDFR